jgi:hypothetical protein
VLKSTRTTIAITIFHGGFYLWDFAGSYDRPPWKDPVRQKCHKGNILIGCGLSSWLFNSTPFNMGVENMLNSTPGEVLHILSEFDHIKLFLTIIVKFNLSI